MIERNQVIDAEGRSAMPEYGSWTALKKGVTAEGLLSGSGIEGCGGGSRN
jgi:hypothetical protein